MTNDRIRNGHQINFWMTPNAFIDDGHIEYMGASAFIVYSILMRCSDASKQCFPSYNWLQNKSGYGRATIAKAIADLTRKGYIRKLSIGTVTHASTLYEILDLSLVPHTEQFKNQTSSESELVQKVNQFRNQTSSESELVTSSLSEPQLVQKVNSKNTNRKILISKNTHSLDAREFFESDKPQDRIADTWADKRNQIANRKESVQVWLDDLEFCKTLIAPLSKFPAYKDCGVADVKKYMRSCCQEQRADSDNRYEWLNDLYQSHQEQLAQLRQNELDRENYLESRQQPQASINAEAVKTPPEMDEKAKAIFDRLMKTRGLKT